jgi:mono/diheme cytochrome c family protein
LIQRLYMTGAHYRCCRDAYRQRSRAPRRGVYRRGLGVGVLFLWWGISLWAQMTPGLDSGGLAWDAVTKEYEAKIGETSAVVSFRVTNVNSTAAVIRAVRPSCGCTIARVPAQPWIIPPQGNGQFQLVVDLRGKRGTLNKYITVDASTGTKILVLRVKIPDPPGGSLQAANAVNGRTRNLAVALGDRQAVFKGTCQTCHRDPVIGKMNEDLYDAACAICHDSNHRATMVPALTGKRDPAHREYWRLWTAQGKDGTLMPGFAAAEGGPLTEAQINSLVDYLTLAAPKGARPGP